MFYLVIRTEKLTKYFGRKPAVQDVTLEVEPGEVYGLLGTPGSGKTTIIRMLLDLVRPTSGRALVLGRDTRHHSLEIRRQVGVLPARFAFHGGQSGEEWLRYLARLRGDVSWEYICSLGDRFKLDLTRPCAQFTTADRQKLGLIQAMMHRPELLLLDEPTQGLDTDAQYELFRLVQEARQEGRSVLYATQSLHQVERVCDRVAVLHQGCLVAVERAVRLRGRSLRRVEMRFAGPVPVELFAGLSNVENIRLEDNLLSCIVRGDPDSLIKIASQYRVMDFLCQQPSLEEVFSSYYGVKGHAG